MQNIIKTSLAAAFLLTITPDASYAAVETESAIWTEYKNNRAKRIKTVKACYATCMSKFEKVDNENTANWDKKANEPGYLESIHSKPFLKIGNEVFVQLQRCQRTCDALHKKIQKSDTDIMNKKLKILEDTPLDMDEIPMTRQRR